MSNSGGVSEAQQLTENNSPSVQSELTGDETADGDLACKHFQDNGEDAVSQPVISQETSADTEAEYGGKDISASTLSPTGVTNQTDEDERNALPEENSTSLSPPPQESAPGDTGHSEPGEEEGESGQDAIPAGGNPFPGGLRDGSDSAETVRIMTSPKPKNQVTAR